MWEPLPLDVAEWMGMDDDRLRAPRPLDIEPAALALLAARAAETAAA